MGFGIPSPRLDPACDLVSQRDGQLDPRLLAGDDVEVGVAHARAGNADEDLGAGRCRPGNLLQAGRLPRRVQPNRPHGDARARECWQPAAARPPHA